MEEILYKAHELGIFEQFMEEVKELRKIHIFKDTLELYETALENILKKINQGVDFEKN